MSTSELVALIKQVKRAPVERDTVYNTLHDYSEIGSEALLTDPSLN